MAGFISIAEGKGVSIGTPGFNYVVERTRRFFKPEDRAIQGEIYGPLDDEGMSLIAVDTQGVEGFNAFCRATELAYAEAASEDPHNVPHSVWQELLQVLRRDPRWTDAVSRIGDAQAGNTA